MTTLTSEQLFQCINEVIVSERLFLDPKFGRQTILDRFHLSKDRVGAAFAQGSCHDSLTDYVQELRLDYSARLLTGQPGTTISDVAYRSGFTSAQYFSRRFRQRFGMSPSDYQVTFIINFYLFIFESKYKYEKKIIWGYMDTSGL